METNQLLNPKISLFLFISTTESERKCIANRCPFLRHDTVETIDQSWKQVKSCIETIWKTIWISPFAFYLRPEIHGMLKYLGQSTILNVNINVITSLFHSYCILTIYWFLLLLLSLFCECCFRLCTFFLGNRKRV